MHVRSPRSNLIGQFLSMLVHHETVLFLRLHQLDGDVLVYELVFKVRDLSLLLVQFHLARIQLRWKKEKSMKVEPGNESSEQWLQGKN